MLTSKILAQKINLKEKKLAIHLDTHHWMIGSTISDTKYFEIIKHTTSEQSINNIDDWTFYILQPLLLVDGDCEHAVLGGFTYKQFTTTKEAVVSNKTTICPQHIIEEFFKIRVGPFPFQYIDDESYKKQRFLERSVTQYLVHEQYKDNVTDYMKNAEKIDKIYSKLEGDREYRPLPQSRKKNAKKRRAHAARTKKAEERRQITVLGEKEKVIEIVKKTKFFVEQDIYKYGKFINNEPRLSFLLLKLFRDKNTYATVEDKYYHTYDYILGFPLIFLDITFMHQANGRINFRPAA